jgi:putative peptide zinc metalloprotease protein
VLLFTLLALVLAAPRLIGTAWESVSREWAQAGLHWDAGQYLDGTGAALAMGAIALPILAMAIMFGRVVVRLVSSLWRRTAGRPVRRAGAGTLVVALGIALALAWWPNPERYQPIRPYEGGTLLNAVAAPLAAVGVETSEPAPADGGEILSVLPDSGPLPSEEEPELALVLVPSDSAGADGAAQPEGSTETVEPGWVFPFNEPLPPEPGDNQALAVNTTDNSVTYEVAIAMVWVTGEDPVLNVNEAYAFASCSDCVTVAVAFQVVVIVGSASVVVPQNLSAAVNYDCFECITASIASQLVVTVDDLPGVEQQIALADLWEDLMAFAATIPTLPLAEVIAQFEDYKEQILEILGVAPLAAPSPTPLPSASPTTSATASPGAAPSSGSALPTASPASSPPAVVPSGTPSPEATPVPGSTSPSPTPSASPSSDTGSP